MAVDRDKIKRKALRAIDRASDKELDRARNDKVYAESWLQKMIGWIANLITILAPVFRGCYIATAVFENDGLSDDSAELEELREFRQEYILDSDDDKLLYELEAYYEFAPGLIRWANSRRDSREVWQHLASIVYSTLNLIRDNKHEEAHELFKSRTLAARRNITLGRYE